MTSPMHSSSILAARSPPKDAAAPSSGSSSTAPPAHSAAPAPRLSPRRPQPQSGSLSRNGLFVVTHLLVGLVAFNMGYIFHHVSVETQQDPLTARSLIPWYSLASSSALSSPLLESGQRRESLNRAASADCSIDPHGPRRRETPLRDSLPASHVGLFAHGVARVSRDDFLEYLDPGVPLDPSQRGNDNVLVLYSNAAALPIAPPQNNTADPSVPLYSAQDATAQCLSLRLVLQQPKKDRECLVIMGQWESHIVHKYMRVADNQARLAASDQYDFRHVSREHKNNGRVAKVPLPRQIEDYWNVLTEYLAGLPETLERLGPVAKAAAGKGRVIVVMTCNWGQASLLANFVCAARSRNLDLSHVLLFATDQETHDLALSLNIHSFFVDEAFGEMPKGAAQAYGDKKFASMMMSKVYCVHLINLLGYDLLFQDVDMYWYRNPLDYFAKDAPKGFDMYFQDDGARSARYAPYSPNSGFYYVRNNERTRYFFSVFLRMGDSILASGSHQSILTSVMIEHASWRGLNVKVFGIHQKEGHLFPGGHHYHRDPTFMRQVIKDDDQVSPYIFHMSWTKNKDNKLKFMQQLGHWHLREQCVDKQVDEVGGGERYISTCCSAEPLVTCHYRDKPSKIPCKDQPPIDQGRRSFW